MRKITELLSRPVPAINLGLFRIFFSVVLLGEVVQLWYFRQLAFDPIPYIEPSYKSSTLLYLPWIAAVLCMVIGFRFRIAAVVNYVYVAWMFGGMTSFLYHFDFTMIGTSVCFIFLPVSQALSMDSRGKNLSTSVPAYCSAALLFVGIFLVYSDSLFHKYGSEMWADGLSFWLPSSLPQTSLHDLTFFLDNKAFVLAAGYLAFVIEAAFCFLFWWRPLRWPLIFLGSTLHLGIVFAFPIPFFGLGAAAFFVLLLPSNFWTRVLGYKPEAFSVQTRPVRVFLALAAAFAIFQGILVLRNAPIPTLNRLYTQVFESSSAAKQISEGIQKLGMRFLGLAPHGVYVDEHFEGYNHIIAIRQPGEKSHIPLIDEVGQAGWYNSGRFFVYWSFRANAPSIKIPSLKQGIERYTAFWSGKNKIDLSANDTSFEIVYKTVNVNIAWERGVLSDSLRDPWIHLADSTWHSGKCTLQLPDIESL
jgi:hypothetical protein